MTLASYVLFGERLGPGDGRWSDFWRALEAEEVTATTRRVESRPAHREAPPPERPPLAEVAKVWSQAGRVDDDAEVSAWLRSRMLDPGRIADLDLARAIRSDARLPRWAWCKGSSWSTGGWRCVMPMFDANGVMVSLHARAFDPAKKPKGVAPGGYELRDSVLADNVGWQLLGGAPPPVWDGRVLIAEGEPDVLTWATRWSEACEELPAVLGIVAGSWGPTIAARVRGLEAKEIIIATHPDPTGEKYAAQIAAGVA